MNTHAGLNTVGDVQFDMNGVANIDFSVNKSIAYHILWNSWEENIFIVHKLDSTTVVFNKDRHKLCVHDINSMHVQPQVTEFSSMVTAQEKTMINNNVIIKDFSLIK